MSFLVGFLVVAWFRLRRQQAHAPVGVAASYEVAVHVRVTVQGERLRLVGGAGAEQVAKGERLEVGNVTNGSFEEAPHGFVVGLNRCQHDEATQDLEPAHRLGERRVKGDTVLGGLTSNVADPDAPIVVEFLVTLLKEDVRSGVGLPAFVVVADLLTYGGVLFLWGEHHRRRQGSFDGDGGGLWQRLDAFANAVTFSNTISVANINNSYISNTTFLNYKEQSYTNTAIGATYTVDLNNGSMQLITLDATTTISMPAVSAGKSFTMIISSGTGGYAVTWNGVTWPEGITPTLTSTASKKDLVSFVSDGSTWYGMLGGMAY